MVIDPARTGGHLVLPADHPTLTEIACPLAKLERARLLVR